MNARITPHPVAESAAMLMIGDGLLGLLSPSRHCLVWRGGPDWWIHSVDWFAQHPEVTRIASVAEIGVGLWMARRGQRDISEPRRLSA